MGASAAGDADPRLPLSALLSQLLIAFTIELDNEWERRTPYRTTDFGGRGVWGVSLRQWSNFMRCVPGEGISVPDLTYATRAEPQLDGMRRWGYVTVESGRVVRPTQPGARAQKVWRPLPDEIEQRWRERFGPDLVDGMRTKLEPVVARLQAGLPDWLTGLHGGHTNGPLPESDVDDPDRRRPLSALISILLQRFALAYERESGASLCFTANVLRLLEGQGVPVAKLPHVSGVAMPALHTALGILQKGGFVEQGSGRGRHARLTGKGVAELERYRTLPDAIEATGCGDGVRPLLEALLRADAPLWPQLEPPPESWRSRVPRPAVLPHFPMPRQGGHPDGV